MWHHYTNCGSQSSSNVVIICSYNHNMEIFLIKFGYHNEYHVENLASIFLIFTPTCGQVEILVAIWLHDASKKIAGHNLF
jgi:hypothetical protein